MSAKDTLSNLAGVMIIVAFIPYIWAICRDRNLPPGTPGKTEPCKASWLIWGILDTITLCGMLVKHTAGGLIIGAVTGVWIVFLVTLKYGKPGWSFLDKLCLGIVVMAISLWLIRGDPNWGIVISCGGLIVGAFPTFKSVWEDPSRENFLAWMLFWIAAALGSAAIKKWTLEDATQPLTFLLIESITILILLFGPNARILRKLTAA
ncbi:MAG: hypothetical protein AAB364_00685 [Patescibacteria group bacterium]